MKLVYSGEGSERKNTSRVLHMYPKPVLFQRLILTCKPITGDEGLGTGDWNAQLHLKTVHLTK